MQTKLLNDVAIILAELGVTYDQADDIAVALFNYFDDAYTGEQWINKASNAPKQGECSCG